MKKGCFRSLFLEAALSLLLITITPLTLAAEEVKAPEPELVKEKLDYRLVYSEKSPLKTIPLNNTEFKVHVYANGTPKGVKELKTNEEAEFDVDKLNRGHSTFIGMSLVTIQDAAKHNQTCDGHLVHLKNELVVTCQKKRQ